MNRRLEQFLAAENISQSSFADSIGVARASVSHILSGRNKPGFDFIENMSRRYPALNLEWLITGKGKMYKESPVRPTEDIFGATLFDTGEDATELPPAPAPAISEKESGYRIEKQLRDRLSADERQLEESGRSIVKIIVFYNDNSFVEIR